MTNEEEIIKSERGHYNKKYSKSKGICGWRLYEKSFFGESLKNLENKSIIEIGCGNGEAIKELTGELNLKKIKYIGIDISSEGIKKGKINYPLGEFLEGDCSQLNYPKNKFDASLCLGVLHHLPNPFESFEELVRVTKRGGIILLREPSERSFKKGDSEHEKGLDIKKFLQRIEENNCEIIQKQKINSFPIKVMGHILNKSGIEKYLPKTYWNTRIFIDKKINRIFKKSFLSGVDYMFIIKKN